MTNKDAIGMVRSALVKTYDSASGAIEAYKIVEDAVEKADKYQWHDLRKNPDDLPKPMSRNVFVFANWNEHCRHEYGILSVGLDGRWCDGLDYLDDVDVIAWKYCDLVPFEVEE